MADRTPLLVRKESIRCQAVLAHVLTGLNLKAFYAYSTRASKRGKSTATLVGLFSWFDAEMFSSSLLAGFC